MSPTFTDNDGGLDWRKVGYHARSAFAVLLSLVVLVGGGWFAYSKVNDAWMAWRTADDYIGEGKDPVQVLIPMGASVTQIGDILVEHEVIKSTRTFRQAAADNPNSSKLQAGRYNLRTQLPAATALSMLLDPTNLVVMKVTLPEGWTLQQQWAHITAKLGIPADDLKAALTVDQVKLPDWSNGQFEGFMFPDTYRVAEPVAALPLLQDQAKQFTKVADELDIAGRAQSVGLTPFQVITVASIIEREVSDAQYRPMVARVIYNRLAKGMKLQFDSTVHYALGSFDKVTTTAEDRAVNSPYNTYLNAGLPPGAISNPGKDAISAALEPADGDWLFFVTVNLDTGETLFASTEEEHLANVAKFREWCQANTGRC